MATFRSRFAGYTLQYGIDKMKVGARKEVEVVKKVAFESGEFKTEDKEIIELLREEITIQKKLRGRPDFYEVTAEDVTDVKKAQERLTQAGSGGSSPFKK